MFWLVFQFAGQKAVKWFVTVLNAAPWRHLFFSVKQKLWLGQLYDEQRKKTLVRDFQKVPDRESLV